MTYKRTIVLHYCYEKTVNNVYNSNTLTAGLL
jgi:hypothetical protein